MRFTAAGFLIAVAVLKGQTLEVSPARAMVDQGATVHAAGLQPGERVTLRAELVDGADIRWASKTDFAADAQGRFDTAMGPVWSMTPES